MTTTDRYISSVQNSDYKAWQLLSQGKKLKKHSLPAELKQPLLLEGEHLCQAWLERYDIPVQVIITEQLLNAGKYQDLWHACSNSKRNILQDNLYKGLSQVKNGIGIFFVVNRPVVQLPNQVEQSCLALDQVQDPGNLGTMLRTAAAAGIKQVFLSTGCAGAWSPKVLRSAQGAHFAIDIFENISLADLSHKYKLPMACTTLDNASNLYTTDLRQNCIWIFGNEGQGVSANLQGSCQLRIRIPQSAQVESLNVAAAAAICLFEQKRQWGDF